jgi:predicted NBD/HSP70 family sugar kinase
MRRLGADAGMRVTSRLLRLIFEQQPLSQSNLRDLTGLSMSTISASIRPLLDSGLVEERGVRREAMGRPQTLLGIAAHHAHVVGVQLNGDRNLIVLTDLAGTLLREHPLPAGPLSPERLADEIMAFMAQHVNHPVAGLGLALAGLVEPDSGICRLSSVLGWRDVAIGALLSARLRLPVVVENDANAFALATVLLGLLPPDVSSAIVMTVGRGLGVGVLQDRRLYRGRHGAAGEVGHIPVAGQPTFACHCGQPVCLESVASIRAIKLALDCGDRTLIDVAGSGATRAVAKVIRQAGGHIGLALAQLAAAFDPDTVCLAMEPDNAAPLLLEAIEQSYLTHRLRVLRQPTPLTFLTGWDKMWAMGAASIALQHFIDRVGDDS